MISTLALARLCGVSQGTVDRALHGRTGVSDATRKKILRNAAKHGHRPHPATREILSGRSKVVQAILPAANNIFFMDLAEQLSVALESRGLRLQITLIKRKESLLPALEDAAARRQLLAVIIPPKDGITVPKIISRHLPMVSLFSPCRNIPFLSPDEEKTGRDGVAFLYGEGHRNIAFLSSSRQAYAIQARESGYRKQMLEFGLRPRIFFSTDPGSWGKNRPTGLFCHNDWSALQAIFAARAAGLEVPKDVSVLGIDHGPTLSALFPELTTMAYPVDALLAEVLAQLEGKNISSLGAARFQIIPGGTVNRLRAD